MDKEVFYQCGCGGYHPWQHNEGCTCYQDNKRCAGCYKRYLYTHLPQDTAGKGGE